MEGEVLLLWVVLNRGEEKLSTSLRSKINGRILSRLFVFRFRFFIFFIYLFVFVLFFKFCFDY